MGDINNVHDKMFKDIFQKPENVKTFLETILPKPLRNKLDFSCIEIDPTGYISKEFDEFFSDVIVKTRMKSKKSSSIPTDVCIIFEHKTETKRQMFVQFLKYMYLEWQKDIDEKRPLRVIIPIVFYHGEKDWKLPFEFADQFDVDDEVKQFLLNYRYILFDTAGWDFLSESNKELKENVFLISGMALMKYAYSGDMETIKEIFKFWYREGFTRDIDNMVFFLIYISETRDISPDQLIKILKESKIDGGTIMQTLADRLRAEGEKIGMVRGEKKGMARGEKTGKRKTAKALLEKGVDIDLLVEATGLTKKELEKLARTNH